MRAIGQISPRSTRQLERFKQETLAFLTTAIPFTGAVFYSVDEDLNAVEHRVRLTAPRSRDPHVATARYASYFHRLDPFHPRRFADDVVSLVTLRDIVSIHEYAASEYYRAFVEPLGLLYETELFLRDQGSIVGGISLLRGRERQDFTDREIAFLRKAQPLLECGFAGWRRSDPSADGGVHGEELSPREHEVVELVCAGASNRAIACELHISLATVKTHIHNMFRKLDVRSRTQLIAAVRRRAAA